MELLVESKVLKICYLPTVLHKGSKVIKSEDCQGFFSLLYSEVFLLSTEFFHPLEDHLKVYTFNGHVNFSLSFHPCPTTTLVPSRTSSS